MANKKIFTDESLGTFVDEIKSYVDDAVATKANTSHTHSISNVTNLQATLDGKQSTVTGGASTITSSNLTANRALVSNGSGKVAVSAVTSTELGYLDGVKSNVQTQLDSKAASSHNHAASNITSGTLSSDRLPTVPIAKGGTGATTAAAALTNLGITATASELNKLDGVTATTAELNYVDGVTSNIQTQLNGKAPSSHTHNKDTINSVCDTRVTWGGEALSGSVSPMGAALSSEHSANRIAYLNPAAVVVEYSNDAGSTWTNSGLSDSAKINFVTTSNAISVGSNSTVTTSHRTRITLTAQNGTTGYVYTRPRKMLINVSTPHGLTATIEAKTGVSGASWTTLGTYNLSGWSGWNDIPMSIATFGGSTNQTGNYWYLRLTFANTSVNSSYTTTKSSIIGLRLFGDTCWTRTSNMGETGHLYSYDYAQNATFPAKVTATTFAGELSGNATTATTASSCTGNSATATKLSSSKTISLTGDVTGSASFDGSANASITATVADDSHNHIISNVDGLQTALDGKASSSHAHSSYVNQNAFSNVVVGSTTIAADSTTDTLTLVGSNVTLTPDSTNDKVTIGITKANVTSALGYTPPTTNTTYSNATTSAAGLMSPTDKTKLDGIASGANAYTLPTASSSALGGVKTTSTVTSTSGLTACPIISGVPYYKDTNTTYSLGSFGVTATANELNILDGVTATATELNYCDGVTSNIQTQLNGKSKGEGKIKTTAATAGWYRIATSVAGIANATGVFQIIGSAAGYHTVVTFSAGTNYGRTEGTSISILQCSQWSNPAITKMRIVYTPTYSGNYAYLEVYSPNAVAIKFSVYSCNNYGWTLIDPNTAGSIPTNYLSKEYTLSNGMIMADGALYGNKQQAYYYDDSTKGQVFGTANSTGGTTIAAGDSSTVQINGALLKTATVVPKTTGTYYCGNTNFRWKGIYSTAAVDVSSDERLKENIVSIDMDDAVNLIENIDVKSFNYIGDNSAHIGVIAQDILEISPELSKYIVTMGDDGYYGVKTSDLVFPLIATVQKMSEEIKEMKKALNG